MEKGTRVKVVGGRKAQGATGTVFWTGPDQYSEGVRVGIRGDDGETYWLNADQLETLEPGEDPGVVAPGEAFEHGDQVTWKAGGEALVGEVFWTGENKFGPGQRLGVRDADDETHWLDAVRVKKLPTPDDVAADAGGAGDAGDAGDAAGDVSGDAPDSAG